MNLLKNISKHTLILLMGTIIAFSIALIQYNTTDLSASVLSLTELNLFESTKWDAGYKKENQVFEVFLSEQVRNEGVLTVSILYSPNDVEIFTDQINTNYNITISQQNEGNLILNIDGYSSGDFSEGIFQLPYNGESKDITLEYIKSQNPKFSIGNLDNIINQSH